MSLHCEERGRKLGEERGRKLGEERGEKRGVILTKQEYLLRLLKTKFGSVPQDVEEKIKTTHDADRLTSLFDQGIVATNISEIQLDWV